MGERKDGFRILVGKPERKRALGIQDFGRWIMLKWNLRN
jgi:hypothetical protein